MTSDHQESDGSGQAAWAKLGAFIDGELPEHEREAVGAALEHDREARARVDAWRAQKAALKALCGAPQSQSNPPSVVVLRTRTSWPVRIAMAASWVAAGIAIGTALGSVIPRIAKGGVETAAFARRADIAYAVYSPEVRHPVEVSAGDEAHLMNWLSKRLGRPLSVPSLREYGYSLVGGRLLPGESGPAAQFMYESNGGARLTLYVARIPGDESAFRLLRDGERRTFYWASDHFGYALSGSISEAKLRAIAVDVCGALGGKSQSWQ
ncbi:anti-sigma factor [Trinickia caryophylli]|uniref:Transmembrane transcriptional regulator (Anti-sigma factor RsiW) n=1 Tax=Trinickia caryophylli TaxID=28094 RepID=A0A1X7D1S1_TRICW|nr:anti-sigma factor [Trinickia caryophylli]PMS13580.1 anti-sigma factor [Trinickia caryophylli]TRX15251.1 anti-sigma factor [Trinickia caryophylli]WQE15125.1 anti-sigma factor [Trinickia caryophylli]SMF06934.1 Transmembrane transcriptional regulator (anti-sigma factor RsiW) [Trinickia caryophylli]GLU31137.1 hypothetical protein Busp01_09790 [Trinickia caryophylli]